MPAKMSPTKDATPSKASKATAYQTIGRTSDGVAVLKPKAATSHPTPLGRKVARLMAKGRSMRVTKGATKVSSTEKLKRAAK